MQKHGHGSVSVDYTQSVFSSILFHLFGLFYYILLGLFFYMPSSSYLHCSILFLRHIVYISAPPLYEPFTPYSLYYTYHTLFLSHSLTPQSLIPAVSYCHSFTLSLALSLFRSPTNVLSHSLTPCPSCPSTSIAQFYFPHHLTVSQSLSSMLHLGFRVCVCVCVCVCARACARVCRCGPPCQGTYANPKMRVCACRAVSV